MTREDKAKILRDRSNALAERIATELHGRKGIIDEVTSELYSITDEFLLKCLEEAQQALKRCQKECAQLAHKGSALLTGYSKRCERIKELERRLTALQTHILKIRKDYEELKAETPKSIRQIYDASTSWGLYTIRHYYYLWRKLGTSLTKLERLAQKDSVGFYAAYKEECEVTRDG
jgi:chromosome segregation ATPase